MEELSKEIMEQLSTHVLWSFKIGNFTVNITNTVVNTWILMAVVALIAFLLTRHLELVPTRKSQVLIETVVGFLNDFFGDILGKEGKKYIPYLCTVATFLAASNTLGLFGLTPPTKNINVTASLAIMSIILIQVAGIRARGVKGWLHSFLEPIWIVTPINILELAIKPLSLCMRLFGNVLGAFVVMELLKCVCRPILPMVFSCYFDIFDGLIQAYVFVFLTSLFMKEAMEVE